MWLMLSYFLIGISFTFYQRFSILQLSMWNIALSSWLGFSNSIGDIIHEKGIGVWTNYVFIIQFLSCSSTKNHFLLHQAVPAALFGSNFQLWPRGYAWHCLFYAIKCLDFMTVIAAQRPFPSRGLWNTKRHQSDIAVFISRCHRW